MLFKEKRKFLLFAFLRLSFFDFNLKQGVDDREIFKYIFTLQ